MLDQIQQKQSSAHKQKKAIKEPHSNRHHLSNIVDNLVLII